MTTFDGGEPRNSLSSSVSTGERRHITVLFADMVGYTSISERLGEEAIYNLMQSVFAIMATAVRDESGTVRLFTGDGIMALFGVPDALEDGPLRACRAGLKIHEHLSQAADDLKRQHGVQPVMRIGINAGPVVVGQIESGWASVSGDTVNMASRLETLAEPGKVAISDAVYRAVQGLVEATFLGERAVKGKSEAQKIWRLETARSDAVRFDSAISRGLSRYVGRRDELEILRLSLSDAAKQMRILDVVGDPGIGKSRLLHEMRPAITTSQSFLLFGACSSDGRSAPLLPFVQVVRGSFRVSIGEAEPEIIRKINEGLSILNLRSDENLALLLNLLGLSAGREALSLLDGTLIGLRTRDILHALLKARCQLSPVVLILEDLHWLDSASEELLSEIVYGSISNPLLILTTRRPEYVPPWAKEIFVQTLALEALTDEQISELVRARLNVAALPETLANLVNERSGGNALFAEEIASYLLERGVVRLTPNGLQYDAGAVTQALPGSVQSLLAARIDRLRKPDRELLQAASAIGRSFDPKLLADVAIRGDATETQLREMEEFELIHLDARTGEYTFKHALIRDALYNGLIGASRTTLHARIAEHIERRSGNRLSEVADTLAHHFALSSQKEKAFKYLTIAAQRSLDVYSLQEALNYLQRAEEALSSLASANSDLFGQFILNYYKALQYSCNPMQIIALHAKYRPLIERMTINVDFVIILHYEIWAYCWMLRVQEAKDAQMRLSEVCANLNDKRSHAYLEASFFFINSMSLEESGDVIFRGRKAIEAASASGDIYISCWLRCMIAWEAIPRGHISRSRALAQELRIVGGQMRDPRAIGLALWLEAWIAILFDDYEAALIYAEEAMLNAITPLDKSVAEAAIATSLVLLKRIDVGAARLRSVYNDALTSNCDWTTSGPSAAMAVLLFYEGNFSKGISFLKDAIKAKTVHGYITAAAWYKITLARIYLDVLEGKEKPALSIIIKNILFVLRLKLNAPREVGDLIDFLETTAHFKEDGYFAALINMLRGRLYGYRRDYAKGMERMLLAKSIISQYGNSPVLATIDDYILRFGRAAG